MRNVPACWSSSRAPRNTSDAAEPVAVAASLTPPIWLAISLEPCAADWILRAISCVAAPCARRCFGSAGRPPRFSRRRPTIAAPSNWSALPRGQRGGRSRSIAASGGRSRQRRPKAPRPPQQRLARCRGPFRKPDLRWPRVGSRRQKTLGALVGATLRVQLPSCRFGFSQRRRRWRKSTEESGMTPAQWGIGRRRRSVASNAVKTIVRSRIATVASRMS